MSTGDEFLDEFLGNDASLDVDGAMPDIKVMDSGINMTGNEVSALCHCPSRSLSPTLSQTDSGGLTDRDRERSERVAEKARARVDCTQLSFLCVSK